MVIFLVTFAFKKWALVTFIWPIAFFGDFKSAFWPKKVGFWSLLSKYLAKKVEEINTDSKMEEEKEEEINTDSKKEEIKPVEENKENIKNNGTIFSRVYTSSYKNINGKEESYTSNSIKQTNNGHNITETKEAYKNSDGVCKSAYQRGLDDKTARFIKEKNLKTGKHNQKKVMKGIEIGRAHV